MNKIREKLVDFKNRLKDRHMLSIVVTAIIICLAFGGVIYIQKRKYRQTTNNDYNQAFYELVDSVQNVETLLAKSLISSTKEHGAESLSEVWKEANLAAKSISMLPISTETLSNTAKFLNQTSDYSYSLFKKNIDGKELEQQDLDKLEELYDYAVSLEETLNQLSMEISEGSMKWEELEKKGNVVLAKEVSNISRANVQDVEQEREEYAGLIYDGAFSEHMTSENKLGLTGENIDEEQAKQKAIEFVGNENVDKIDSKGEVQGDIECFSFEIKLKNENDEKNTMNVDVTKKGGHILQANYNREIDIATMSDEEAIQKGIDFLKQKGYSDMKQTYYIKEGGYITINYAYTQNNVVIYPDLIILKIALDNGQVMGIESKGYLNSHTTRKIDAPQISKEQAKQKINKNLEILSEGLSIIPTEFRTEVYCWEFKGKIKDREFLVYINAGTGEEENILVIINTPNGTLTM